MPNTPDTSLICILRNRNPDFYIGIGSKEWFLIKKIDNDPLLEFSPDKDYQRIANELRDNGKEIEWTARGPVSILRDENGNKIGELNVSFMFMYPSIISSENVSP